jgi:hypothetical protein
MRYVHVLKEQKVAAVAKVERYINLAKKFKESQEERK